MNDKTEQSEELTDTLAEGIAAVMAADEAARAPRPRTWPTSSSKSSTASGPNPPPHEAA